VLQQDRLQGAEHLAGLDAMCPAADLQVDVLVGQLQLPEECGAHGVVVVLPGVHQDLVMFWPQLPAHRRCL